RRHRPNRDDASRPRQKVHLEPPPPELRNGASASVSVARLIFSERRPSMSRTRLSRFVGSLSSRATLQSELGCTSRARASTRPYAGYAGSQQRDDPEERREDR